MGGAGGGAPRLPQDPRKMQESIRDLQERSESAEFRAKLNALLAEMLARYNARDVEAITEHMVTLVEAVAAESSGATAHLGGSIEKNTYVEGRSDVDALLILRDSDLAGKTPRQVLALVRRALRQRLPNSDVTVGDLAVTVRFSDGHEVQLLPAFRSRGGGYRIPSTDGRSWTRIRPDRFTDALTRVNQACGAKVVPTIKLAKAVNDGLPENKRLTGYHIEALAVEVFGSYAGPRRQLVPSAMLPHFLRRAESLVRSPMPDVTGQSEHVDEYLGPAGSAKRQAVSRELLRLAKRMSNASASEDLERWRALFGDSG